MTSLVRRYQEKILREDTRGPWCASKPMRIKFWGVRGSTPTPQPENIRYGGNTSCVEVLLADRITIFDSAIDFRVLSQQLQTESGEKHFAAQDFSSHFH